MTYCFPFLKCLYRFSQKKGKSQFGLKTQIKQNNKLKGGHSNYLFPLPRSREKKNACLGEQPSWRNGSISEKSGKFAMNSPIT